MYIYRENGAFSSTTIFSVVSKSFLFEDKFSIGWAWSEGI